ncbi:MAG: nuclear transport factor 2 family protein [Solirubrobacterales bacterium]
MAPGLSVTDLRRVLDAYEAIGRRDLDGVMAVLGENPTIQTQIETHDGVDAVGHMFAEAFATEFVHEQQALLIDGARVVVLSRIGLVGWSSGIQAEQEIVEVWSVDGRGSIGMRVMDREEGLRETGLEERAARVATVYESFEVLNRGDFQGASNLWLLHPDIELHRGETSLETEPVRGIEELERFMEPDVFESQYLEPRQVIDAGDRAVISLTFRVRAAGSGIELENRGYQVATLRGGRVVRLEIFQDRDAALDMLFEPSTGG